MLFWKEEESEESINNYVDIFKGYLSNPPTLIEALEQVFKFAKIENSNNLIKEEIGKSKNRIENNFDKIKKNNPEITKEESIIISCYLSDSPLCYTINKTLREDKKNIKNISKYLFLFIKSLRKLKKYYPESKYLYRGIGAKENSFMKGEKKNFL